MVENRLRMVDPCTDLDGSHIARQEGSAGLIHHYLWLDNVLRHVLPGALLTSKTRQRDNAHLRDPQAAFHGGIFALSKGVISVQNRHWSFRWQTG